VSSQAVVVAEPRERRRVAADLIALTKPRVVLMVLVTTVVGYYVGLTGAPDYLRLVHLLIGHDAGLPAARSPSISTGSATSTPGWREHGCGPCRMAASRRSRRSCSPAPSPSWASDTSVRSSARW
jgi:hypothetical protein